MQFCLIFVVYDACTRDDYFSSAQLPGLGMAQMAGARGMGMNMPMGAMNVGMPMGLQMAGQAGNAVLLVSNLDEQVCA
jgi:Asp-tRNA(Asn)/Glu-tRNA(Gln) amidotransferase A subunit family amidase